MRHGQEFLLDPDTVQGMLALNRRRSPDPVSIPLPDGSVREGEIVSYGHAYPDGSGGYIELRVHSEGASTLGLGATTTVRCPELGWDRDDNFPIRSARVSHSTNGGEDRGDTEASILLLSLAKELRDLLDEEAPVALARVRERMMCEEAEAKAQRKAENDRCGAIVARLLGNSVYGRRVRVTTAGGSRPVGTLRDTGTHRSISFTDRLGGLKSVPFNDVRLFEVQDLETGRYRPFELEPGVTR